MQLHIDHQYHEHSIDRSHRSTTKTIAPSITVTFYSSTVLIGTCVHTYPPSPLTIAEILTQQTPSRPSDLHLPGSSQPRQLRLLHRDRHPLAALVR